MASTPIFSKTMPLTWEAPPNGLAFKAEEGGGAGKEKRKIKSQEEKKGAGRERRKRVEEGERGKRED